MKRSQQRHFSLSSKKHVVSNHTTNIRKDNLFDFAQLDTNEFRIPTLTGQKRFAPGFSLNSPICSSYAMALQAERSSHRNTETRSEFAGAQQSDSPKLLEHACLKSCTVGAEDNSKINLVGDALLKVRSKKKRVFSNHNESIRTENLFDRASLETNEFRIPTLTKTVQKSFTPGSSLNSPICGSYAEALQAALFLPTVQTCGNTKARSAFVGVQRSGSLESFLVGDKGISKLNEVHSAFLKAHSSSEQQTSNPSKRYDSIETKHQSCRSSGTPATRGEDKRAVVVPHVNSCSSTGKQTDERNWVHFALSELTNPKKCETDQIVQHGTVEAQKKRKEIVFSSLFQGSDTDATNGAKSSAPSISYKTPSKCFDNMSHGGHKKNASEKSSLCNFTVRKDKERAEHKLPTTEIQKLHKHPPALVSQEAGSFEEKDTFPEKLMKILSRDDTQHAITWLPEGVAFSIVDCQAFLSDIAPHYFKDLKLDSFLRRLYRWGFKKVSSVHCTKTKDSEIVYWHKLFLRAEPKLCSQIRIADGRRRGSEKFLTEHVPVSAKEYEAQKAGEKAESLSSEKISDAIRHQWAAFDRLYR